MFNQQQVFLTLNGTLNFATVLFQGIIPYYHAKQRILILR